MKEIIEWGRAVCFSTYRRGQHPDKGPKPILEEIKADLDMVVRDGFKYIRMYDSSDYARNVCKVIRDNNLPIKVMLGPGLINSVNNTGCTWNKTVYTDEQLAERKARNDKRIEALCEIAKEYSDVINVVSVGNENTPDWGENTVAEETLIEYAEKLRKETGKPVTFNEGAREWFKLKELPKHLDIISVHSYSLWYGEPVENAIKVNKSDIQKVINLHGKDKQVLFSEVGWCTSQTPGNGMKEGEATEEKQVQYIKELWDWTDKEKIIAYIFEMFDEPWKGSAIEEESEKHWGLYYEDRTPKPVAKADFYRK